MSKGSGEGNQPSGASWVVEVGVTKLCLRPERWLSEGHVRTREESDERFRSQNGREVQKNPQAMLGDFCIRDRPWPPAVFGSGAAVAEVDLLTGNLPIGYSPVGNGQPASTGVR